MYLQLVMHLNVIFTFQYGEIKRCPHNANRHPTKVFTFQYGEIKSLQDGAPRLTIK